MLPLRQPTIAALQPNGMRERHQALVVRDVRLQTQCSGRAPAMIAAQEFQPPTCITNMSMPCPSTPVTSAHSPTTSLNATGRRTISCKPNRHTPFQRPSASSGHLNPYSLGNLLSAFQCLLKDHTGGNQSDEQLFELQYVPLGNHPSQRL